MLLIETDRNSENFRPEADDRLASEKKEKVFEISLNFILFTA